MLQKEALAILKTGAPVFLTGEPGSGKTHVTRTFISYLREHGIEQCERGVGLLGFLMTLTAGRR